MEGDQVETLDQICQLSKTEKIAEYHTWKQFKDNMVWSWVLSMTIYHVGFIIAILTYIFDLHSEPVKPATIYWIFAVGSASMIGVTAGAHRLWGHRAYKATFSLKLILAVFYTAMGLYPLWYWVRDHRAHHKYTETDSDPHNARRGFIFSHYGWIVMKRHPDCVRRVEEIDMSDMSSEPIVMFTKKYGRKLKWLGCFLLPTLIPIIFWNETVIHAILTQCFIRYVIFMNFVLGINSVAHHWGERRYNRLIKPADNPWVSFCTAGEGSHNYHHTFPWDYKASERPYTNFNGTTMFIDLMAKMGLAYDLRSPSPELIDKVVRRIGVKSGTELSQ